MKKMSLEERVRQVLGNCAERDKAKKIVNLLEQVLIEQRKEILEKKAKKFLTNKDDYET